MFCVLFYGFLKIIAPGVGFNTVLSARGVGVGGLSLRPGGGEFALSKNSPLICPGRGVVSLGID